MPHALISGRETPIYQKYGLPGRTKIEITRPHASLLLTLAVLMGRKAPSASSSAAADMPRGVSSIVSEDGGCGAHMLGTRSPVDWFTTGVEGRRTFGTAVLSVAALYTCGRAEVEWRGCHAYGYAQNRQRCTPAGGGGVDAMHSGTQTKKQEQQGFPASWSMTCERGWEGVGGGCCFAYKRPCHGLQLREEAEWRECHALGCLGTK